MHKLLINQASMPRGSTATQALGDVFDGVARHTPEGHGLLAGRTAGLQGGRAPRDEPFGDFGLSG